MTKDNDNPLLDNFGLPQFDQIDSKHVKPAVKAMLRKARNLFAQLENNHQATWESLIAPLNEIEALVHHTWSPVSHLTSVLNSKELREVHQSAQGEIISFSLELSQSKKIYEGLKKLKASQGWEKLELGQQRAVEDRILSAELSGIALTGKQQERFNEIVKELSELGVTFSNHVLDATKEYSLIIEDKKSTDGLSKEFLQRAHEAYVAQEKPKDPQGAALGPWLVSLDMTSYIPFMENCKNKNLREELYRAFIRRASSGKHNNEENITKILTLRKEKAQILGFKSYAELSLTQKMAQSVDEIHELEEELRVPSWKAAQEEFQEITDFSYNQTKNKELGPWDLSYWSKRLQEEKFQFTEEEIKPYFSLTLVLEGLFDLVHHLFDISIQERKDGMPKWHSDVRFFDIFDHTKQHIASFYLDPYSRPENKRGGAWMDVCISRRKDMKGNLIKPVAYLVCNFTPPIGDRPSLLTFREVETIFHEFGHGLQHMLTTVDYSDVSGIEGIAWDAVELPSQFMENWCYHRKTFFNMAKHYKTNEPMPESFYHKLLKSKTYLAGLQMLRQLQFGLVDMSLHAEDTPSNYDAVHKIYQEIANKTAVLSPLQEDRYLCSFMHIFAGGYAAGYYSYKWAEVLSADAFSAFEEVGLDNEDLIKKTGRRFRDTILSLGGSRTPLEVFKLFRGRGPSTQALLRHSGLENAS